MQASGYSDDEKSIRSDDDQRSDQSREASEDEEGRRSEAENDDKKDSASKPDKKPKKKGPVRRVLLSEDELTGKNGMLKLQEMFSNFTFKGKGHEKQDLDLMLYRYEQWTHVLFPKHPFAQLLERIELLGAKKRAVKVHLKKIRMGLINNDGNEDVLSEPEMEGEKQTSDAENDPPENPDTWSRIKANSEVVDNTGDWPNDDEFPDDDDELFATIDMGDESFGVAQTDPQDASNLSTRMTHSSVSSVKSIEESADRSRMDAINSPAPSSISSRQRSIRKGSESPRSDISQSSSSAMSSSQISKKSFNSPSSVRSKSSSSSILSTKPKKVKRKSRLRAIMEDSDSENDASSLRKSSISSSDSEPDESKGSGSRFSKTIISSDEEGEPSQSRKLGNEPSRYSARRVVCSDSEDDDANVSVRPTSTKGDSSDNELNPPSPQASNGSSHSSKSSPKRNRTGVNTQFFEQTTMIVTGTSSALDPRGPSTILSYDSDSSEGESRAGLETRKHGKRPRADSSEDELGVNTSRVTSLRRRRVVSDSDDD